MPSSMPSLPPEILINHLFPLLAAEEVIVLCEIFDIPVTRQIYHSVFPEKTHFANYSLQALIERTKASVCYFESNSSHPSVPLRHSSSAIMKASEDFLLDSRGRLFSIDGGESGVRQMRESIDGKELPLFVDFVDWNSDLLLALDVSGSLWGSFLYEGLEKLSFTKKPSSIRRMAIHDELFVAQFADGSTFYSELDSPDDWESLNEDYFVWEECPKEELDGVHFFNRRLWLSADGTLRGTPSLNLAEVNKSAPFCLLTNGLKGSAVVVSQLGKGSILRLEGEAVKINNQTLEGLNLASASCTDDFGLALTKDGDVYWWERDRVKAEKVTVQGKAYAVFAREVQSVVLVYVE